MARKIIGGTIAEKPILDTPNDAQSLGDVAGFGWGLGAVVDMAQSVANEAEDLSDGAQSALDTLGNVAAGTAGVVGGTIVLLTFGPPAVGVAAAGAAGYAAYRYYRP